MKNQVKGFGQFVHESDSFESIPKSDSELLDYIDSQLEKYRGKTGQENLLKLKHAIKEDPSSELARRSRDLLSAHLNLKQGILQTLSSIRREILLRSGL